ncbi:hypothetical protein FIBSPDRAFT_1012129 [Athelia psychrophila]|uniref:Uncharacterized protein n=1 Tax=Athelia psychrophila TaxID=1759441 RepID=A0A166MS84_9AGAM|nr:hypothetical protein FIBSPDRAFT_1012129 [Fibularhizoctonia sp. CBS 109695]
MSNFDDDSWHTKRDIYVRNSVDPQHQMSPQDVIFYIVLNSNGALNGMSWNEKCSLVAEPGVKDMIMAAWNAGPLKDVRNWSKKQQRPILDLLSDIPSEKKQGKSEIVQSSITNLTISLSYSIRMGQADDMRSGLHEHGNHVAKFWKWEVTPTTRTGNARVHTAISLREVDRRKSFFKCLFEEVLSELKEYASKSECKYKYMDLVGWWRQRLEVERRQLYIKIDIAARKLQKSYAAVDAAENDALQALRTLCTYIKDNTSDTLSDKIIIMYFDEADTLTKTFAPQFIKTRYDVLCSVLYVFKKQPVFGIFLSTAMRLAPQPAPTGRLAPSARIAMEIKLIQAPITETPFDCSPNLPVDPDSLTLDQISKISFMARFGRPLFWSLIAGAPEGKERQILDAIIPFARAKITCPTDGQTSAAGRAAVIDIRLMLDYEPRRQLARDRESELVASHMRIAYSVPQSREYMRSGYPSEPILAEAAAQQMCANPEEFSALRIVEENITGGLIDRGERGELVARLLVTLALDRAVKRSGHDVSCSRGVSLIAFIEELFGDRAEHILDSIPDNTKSKVTFREAFKHAWVRFTHFGKMGDATGTTLAAARAAFIRCMAIICRSGQMLVDFLLPIFFCPDGAKSLLTEANMSALLIQVKRRAAKGAQAKYAINQSIIGFFPDGTANQQPYVTLVMELGVQPNMPQALAESIATPAAVPPTPSKLDIAAQGHATDVHPRYSIFAYGCSDTVYGVIAPDERARYQNILASRDFLHEHPRQTHRSLDAVKRLKPFFSIGLSSYHWIQDAKLDGAQAIQLSNMVEAGYDAEYKPAVAVYTDEDFAEDSVDVGSLPDPDRDPMTSDGEGAPVDDSHLFSPTLGRKRAISDTAEEGTPKKIEKFDS